MSGFVLVRDNPFWARVSADGSFAIPDVPAGTLGGEGLARALGRERPDGAGREEAAAVEAAFTLDASKYKRAPHKNKFGKDYEVGEKY